MLFLKGVMRLDDQSPQTDQGSKPSYDAIALAAYFIALDRMLEARPPTRFRTGLKQSGSLLMPFD
jgi:hypothetical protein